MLRASTTSSGATVWWSDVTGCGFRAYATFWPSREIAEAHKQVDPSAIVVNVSRTAKTESNEKLIQATTIPPLEHPYPPERVNLDPRRVTANYDGWSRAAARPISMNQ
jgi:hypothetical protein